MKRKGIIIVLGLIAIGICLAILLNRERVFLESPAKKRAASPASVEMERPKKIVESEKPAAAREAGFGPPGIHLDFDHDLVGKGIKITDFPKDVELFAFIAGKTGKALLIDHGRLEFVEDARTAGFFSRSYTLCLWFMLPDPVSYRADRIVIARSALFALDVRNTNKCILFMRGAQGGHFQVNLLEGGNPPAPNAWYHLAIAYESAADTYRFYLNGRPAGMRKAPFEMASSLDVLTLGGSSDAQAGTRRVALDEFKVYSYPRSAPQVAKDAQVPVQARPRRIVGRITFAGQPIVEFTQQTPSFWFRNESTYQQQNLKATYQRGTFSLEDVLPGKYGVDIRFRTGTGYSGHFTAWKTFTVNEFGPAAEVEVSMSHIMHLTSPQDNDQGLDRWSAKCRDKAAFRSPVRFAWDEVMAGATYQYEIEARTCESFKRTGSPVTGTTQETEVTIPLPVSAEDAFYVLRLSATWEGFQVGRLETYGKVGGRGWDYRFRVEKE